MPKRKGDNDEKEFASAVSRRGVLRLVPITIMIGEPIFFTTAEVQSPARDIYQRLSQRVMDAIAALHLE